MESHDRFEAMNIGEGGQSERKYVVDRDSVFERQVLVSRVRRLQMRRRYVTSLIIVLLVAALGIAGLAEEKIVVYAHHVPLTDLDPAYGVRNG